MQADPLMEGQGPPVEPTVNQARSYARWQQLGQDALRLTRPLVLRRLREVIAECEALIVYEHWLANAQNITRTSEALGLSRLRVRKLLRARRGKEHDPCTP